MRKKEFGPIMDLGFSLASHRMNAADPESCNDASRLVLVLPALLLGRHSSGPDQARPGAAWLDVVKARVLRLLRGEFQELFESITSGAPSRGGGRPRG